MGLRNKAENLPATQKMLMGVKKELKHDLASLEAKMNSRFNSMDSKIEDMHSEIQSRNVKLDEHNSHMKLMLDTISLQNVRLDRAGL